MTILKKDKEGDWGRKNRVIDFRSCAPHGRSTVEFSGIGEGGFCKVA